MSVTLTERVDVRKLTWLLENWNEFGEKVTSSRSSIGTTRSILETYLQKLTIVPGTTLGEVDVQYTTNVQGNRMFSRNGTFLQGMSGVANHTISSGILEDWDIVNCHPTLLVQYCEKNNIKCDILKEYVSDRDTFSEEVQDEGEALEGRKGMIEIPVFTDGVQSDEIVPVKIAVLKSINGGCLYEDTHPKMTALWEEMDGIRERVMKLNPKLLREAKKKSVDGSKHDNVDGRTISYLMGELESKCLTAINKFLTSKGIAVRVFCFDGLMVDQTKKDGTKITLDESKALMAGASDYVYDNEGYRVKIIRKEMTKGLEVPDDWGVESKRKVNYKSPIIGVYETQYVKVTDVPKNEEWARDIEFPEGYTSVAIKQRLGGGKTTSIIRYINEEKPESVIYLSPRRTFANAITTELNSKLNPDRPRFKCYLDVPKGGRAAFRDSPYIVISMESLYWLAGSDKDINIIPELLVVDEVHANLVQHTCLATNKTNFDFNVDYFRKIIERSPRKIFADAFLGQKFIRFISNLEVPTMVYNYLRRPREKRVEFVRYDLKNNKKSLESKLGVKINPSDSMMFKLLKLLEDGKKVYCVCSSKNKVQKWHSVIARKFPGKKILTYTGGKNASFKDGVNGVWNKYDLVMTTTTITVGISFDVLHFDCICLHVSTMSRNRLSDVFQAHFRVRRTRDNVLYCSLDEWCPGGFHLPVTFRRIEDDFDWREGVVISWRKNFDYLPCYLKGLFIDNTFDTNISSMKLKNQTLMFLDECNYVEKKGPDINIDEIERIDIPNEITKEYTFKEIPTIDMTEMNMLMKKRGGEGLTDIEKLQVDKAMFSSCFTRDVEAWIADKFRDVFWQVWIDHGHRKIRNLSREYKARNDIVSVSDLISRDMDVTKYAGINGGKTMQLQTILSICDALGIKHSNDTGAVIEGNQVKSAVERLVPDAEAIKKVFNLRDQSKSTDRDVVSKTMSLTSQALSSFGFSQLVVHKRRRGRGQCSSYIVKPSKGYKKKLQEDALPKDIYEAIEVTKSKVNDVSTRKPVIKGVSFEAETWISGDR